MHPRSLVAPMALIAAGMAASTAWGAPVSIQPTPTPASTTKEHWGDCQPDVFVPGETALVEVDGHLQVPGAELETIVSKTSLEGAKPPTGMQIDRWDFTCGPSGVPDMVIEIRQGGARKALFTHITQLDVVQDGRQLFFVNAVRAGTRWKVKARLLDLHSWEVVSLAAPGAPCVGWGVQVSEQGILTQGNHPNFATHQEACLWSSAGRPVGAFRYRGGYSVHAQAIAFDPPLVRIMDIMDCETTAVDLRRGIVRVLDSSQAQSCEEVLERQVTAASFDRFGRLKE